ncbi:MAG: hypothetical protein ACRDS0_18940 [Pseudonocardiaceae bacterium]
MFRRKQVAQNEIVAYRMRKFFKALENEHRSEPEKVAEIYSLLLWNGQKDRLVDDKRLSRSRFYVGLSTGDNFDELTKRTVLVSDTLLLSHDWAGEYHHLAKNSHFMDVGGPVGPDFGTMCGIHCPNLAELGRWILDVEPLLKAGLVWYLPSYSTSAYVGDEISLNPADKPKQAKAIDYLIRDGRAVDASGAEPIKSQLVRPVLRIDLPFIDGVNLQNFSKITVEEFSSYSAFRDFLRLSFLDMDMALNAVQSDRELLKLSLQIKDHIRSARSEMVTARRKRAVAVTGAVIGSVGAILVAVYGPALALAAAVAAIGATGGGVWGIIHATTENSTHALREDKWYYVWALAKKSNTHVI